MAYQKQTFIDNVTVLNASMLNHIEEGIYNVEQNTLNKAELNSEGVIKSEHLPSNLLTQENLPATINAALAQAKASGEFKGDPGESGVYIGSGEMPEDCNVQIDPTGNIIDFQQLKSEVLNDLIRDASYITPQMYGAKGDGITDDTQAFKQTIANANSLILIPSGTYLISETLTIDKQVIITGVGCEQSIVKYNGMDYLFRISTNSKNRAIIRNMNFLGTDSNSLIYCGLDGWGASFKMEDCLIRMFGGVIFDLVSAFGVSVLNTRIIASGIVKTRPYNEELDVGSTLSNANYFDGVYWTGYPKESTSNMFELNNAQYFSFRNCAFEAASNIFSLTNHSKDIVLNECNLEQANTIYEYDSTCEPPKFLNTRATYAVDKFDKNSNVLDYMVADTDQTTRMFVRNGSDTMGTLFTNSPVLFHKKVVINNNATPQTATIYKLTTHGLDTLLPINLKRIVFKDDSTISYDLRLCTNNCNVSVMYDIDAFIEYDDNSYRWVTTSVLGKSFDNMIFSNTVIKKISAEDTNADSDNGVFELNGNDLIYVGDYNFKQFTLLIRSNVTGQAY
jgi:hypothetical protein